MINTHIYPNKEKILVMLFSLLVFGFYSYIVFTINIHGDSKYHALSAKVSVEQGSLTPYQPYRIYTYQNNERIYMPIAYPLTAESLFTVMYLFGNENMLKLYAPLFATIIFLISYLCIRELGIVQASIASAFGVLAIGERLIMTPLMEPYFIVALLIVCLLLKKYFIAEKPSLLYLSAFFIGVASSVKQQGLILSLYFLFFIFSFFIYKLIKKKYTTLYCLKTFSFIILIAFFVPFLAFSNQISRTGTLAYAPGGTGLNSSIPFSKYIQPILTSKFPSNPAALEAIRETIGYNKDKVNLINKLKGFIMSPFLYYRSVTVDFYESYQLMLISFIPVLFLFGLLSKEHIVMKDRFLLLLFFGAVGTETISSFLFRTPITQYHSFGVLLTTILIFFFAFRFTIAGRYLRLLVLSILTIFFITGYVTYLYPLWGQSGRENNTQLEAYKRIGNYVKNNTSPNAVFLAAETSFRYYAQRDIVWLNESIGDSIHTTVSTSNDKTAVDALKKLRADYIVINRDQEKRVGVNDYLPPKGLVSFIDHSKYFTKVYDAYGDNQMVVYKINYLN